MSPAMRSVRWLRPAFPALLTVLLTVRPLVSAEIAPRWAARIDLALIGSSLLVLFARRRRVAALRHVALPVSCWFAALGLGAALHGVTAEGLRDGVALASGPILLCAAATMQERERRGLLPAILAAGAIISGFAIWQSLSILPDLAAASAGAPAGSAQALLHEVSSRRRALGTFALPTLLAGYLSLLIPLSIETLTRRRTQSLPARVLACGALILIGMGWLLARSIGAWMSLAAACAVVWSSRRICRRQLATSLIATVICGAAILAGRPGLWNEASGHHPLRNRLVYWQAAGRMIAEHPLRGVGPGQFARAYSTTTAAPNRWARHAHNTYLQMWAERGVLAFIAWCWLIIAVLKQTAGLSPWLAVSIWVLPLHNVIDFSFYVPQVSFLWWYLAGWALCRSRLVARCPGQKVSDTFPAKSV